MSNTNIAIDTRPFPYPEPRRHPVLADYFTEVLKWHGYVRFLGLPHLKENPDVPIERLYVQPHVAKAYISADHPPDRWSETETALAALERERKILILGDP